MNGAFVAGDIRVQENPISPPCRPCPCENTIGRWICSSLLIQTGPATSSTTRRGPSSPRRSHGSPITTLFRTCSVRTPSSFLPGYKPTADPRLTEEFAGAAFRFGHSIVSANLEDR